jgi:hypothetical protein
MIIVCGFTLAGTRTVGVLEGVGIGFMILVGGLGYLFFDWLLVDDEKEGNKK